MKKRIAFSTSRPCIVVSIRKKKGVGKPYDVYIGRRLSMGGWDLKESKWHNPFTVREYGNIAVVCQKYKEYVCSKPELMASIGELVGKVLGCWCREDGLCNTCGKNNEECKCIKCHGDILNAIAAEYLQKHITNMKLLYG